MVKPGDILKSSARPKEKQSQLVQAVISGEIPVAEFIDFFESAGKVDKGACADAIKHISAARPELLAPHLDLLIGFINYPLPRVKWGIPEAIGNMAKDFPNETSRAIPYLLNNTANDERNTTVIRWCAAFALGEIAKHNPETREELMPIFKMIINEEQNSGVRNVYLKAIKSINKQVQMNPD